MKKKIALILVLILIILIIIGIEVRLSFENLKNDNTEKYQITNEVSTNVIQQEETNTDFSNNVGYDYNVDMINTNSMYYKIINNYQTYTDDLKKWNNLVKMTETDFENSFLLVIAGENYDTTGLYISNITTDDNSLYIDLNKKEKYDGSTVISTKVNKDLYRDTIVIRNNPNVPETADGLLSMEDIPIGYTIEQALADGCFVIEKENVISEDKDLLDKFIENSKNGIDGFIRIYELDIIDNVTITDLEYKSQKYNMSQCNKTNPGNNIVYNSGNRINKDDSGIYWLSDELGNDRSICSISE